MEKFHVGLLDSPDCPGSGITVSQDTISNLASFNSSLWSGEGEGYSGGSRHSTVERCHNSSESMQGPVRFKYFSGRKEDWGYETSYQSQIFKPICEEATFQDGKPEDCFEPNTARGLPIQYGSHGCILQYSSGKSIQEVPQVLLAGPAIRVPSYAVRTEYSPSFVYKGHKTSSRLPSCTGTSGVHLHRRRNRYGENSGIRCGSSQTDGGRFPKSGFCDKLQEVFSGSHSTDHISGIYSGYTAYDGISVRGEDGKSSIRNTKCFEKGCNYHSSAGKNNWTSGVSFPSSFCGSFALSGAGTAESACTAEHRFVQQSSMPEPAVNSSVAVVASEFEESEWKTHATAERRVDSENRCFREGLGSHIGWGNGVRNVYPETISFSHEHSGVVSSKVRTGASCVSSSQYSCHSPYGQLNSGVLSEQNGGHSFGYSQQSGSGDMGVGSSPQHLSFSSVYCRKRQCGSGLSEQDTTGSNGLDAQSQDIFQGVPEVLPSGRGFVCKPDKSPSSVFCSLESRSSRIGDGRILTKLEKSAGVCVSTIHNDPKGVEEGVTRQCPPDSDNAKLANTRVVASSVKHGCKKSNSSSSRRRTTHSSTRRDKAPTKDEFILGRLGSVRRCYRNHGISKRSTDIMFASWRKRTNKQYESAWSKWLSWCTKRKIDPISTSVNNIIKFLTVQFDKGLSYSCVNTYRSALSTTHVPIDGVPVGQHPFIIRLLRGMFNLRPSIPRYAVTWDVSVVLSYLKNLPPSNLLTLKELSMKLAMLISLTSADRGQSLALLDIGKKSVTHSKVTFFITDLTKCSVPGKGCKELVIPAFHDKKLCVKYLMNVYLKRTKLLRGNVTKLFISYQKPHRSVGSATLARWIKTVLCKAGVVGYNAHSTRGAATSAAASAGLPVHTIMKAADWSSESTFNRFYRRGVDTSEFGRCVLRTLN